MSVSKTPSIKNIIVFFEDGSYAEFSPRELLNTTNPAAGIITGLVYVGLVRIAAEKRRFYPKKVVLKIVERKRRDAKST